MYVIREGFFDLGKVSAWNVAQIVYKLPIILPV